MPPKPDTEPTKAAKLQAVKRRLGGFRTAFNTKLKGGHELAKQAFGPPPLKSPIVATQLSIYLSEIGVPYEKIRETIESILQLTEDDDDDTSYQHYSDYLSNVTREYDEVRNYITLALDSMVEQKKRCKRCVCARQRW